MDDRNGIQTVQVFRWVGDNKDDRMRALRYRQPDDRQLLPELRGFADRAPGIPVTAKGKTNGSSRFKF